MGKKLTCDKAVILALILLCLSAAVRIMLLPAGDLDEIWNYNISRAFAMDYVPYRDFSLVQPPLFFFLASLPLRIVRMMIVYRVFEAVGVVAVIMAVYAFSRLSMSPRKALIPAAAMAFFADHFTYNSLAFLSVLLFCILTSEKEGKMITLRYFAAGIILVMTALSRQTTGGILILFELAYVSVICFREKRYSKILLMGAGAAASCAVFASVLLLTSSFGAFWEYCLLSLFSFGSANASVNYAGGYLLFMGGVITAGIIVDIMKKRPERLVLILILMTVAIPITEPFQHLVYAFIFALAEVLTIKIPDKRIFGIIVPACAFTVSGVILMITFVLSAGAHPAGEGEVKGIMTDGLFDGYGEIAKKNEAYEKEGYRVVTISGNAAIVSIMKGTYTPHFDLFLGGNLGLKTPEEYVDELLAEEGTVIVIPRDYDSENWQNPKGIRKRIVNGRVPFDEYGPFEYYMCG